MDFVADIQSFIKVWIAAIVCVCYCYFVVKQIPIGFSRFLSILPIIYLFITLPLNLSIIQLSGPTILYLVWLGNFKLLLFCFDKGPLSSHHQPPLSFLQFISIALLPINPSIDSTNPKGPSENSPPNSKNRVGVFKKFQAAIMVVKLALLGLIIYVYSYRQYLHPWVLMAFYCCNTYIAVELALAITVFPVRALLGLELDPQFNEPYLATSLQDFWGRRWNLMVSRILRAAVYDPVRKFSATAFGQLRSSLVATLASFLVSGLMHEIIYYYVTRAAPTWEVTWFFIIQGVAVAIEIAAKKALRGRWRLHPAVSGPLTIGYVMVSGARLFFPQLIRNGIIEKVINEYSVMIRFVEDGINHLRSSIAK